MPGRGKNQYVPTDKLSVGIPTYAADAATATGVSERTVRRDTRFGEVLKPYRAELADTETAHNQRELLTLAALIKSKPEQGQAVGGAKQSCRKIS